MTPVSSATGNQASPYLHRPVAFDFSITPGCDRKLGELEGMLRSASFMERSSGTYLFTKLARENDLAIICSGNSTIPAVFQIDFKWLEMKSFNSGGGSVVD